MAGPTVPTPYRVVATRRETHDVVTLELEPVATALPVPAPGQFFMLWAYGIGEVPISVSGLPGDGRPQRHTIRAVGPVTDALCALRRDAVVGARGPYGRGWAIDAARRRDLLVIAGGMGFAPLRPVVEHAVAHRDDFRRVTLLVGARTPDDLLYPDALGEWRARFDTQVEVTVDSAAGGWRGDVGVVTKLLARAQCEAEHTTAMVCGPEVMMRFAVRALLDQGVAPADVQVSLERNMHCGVALCGHCQLGPFLLCRDGPVVTYDRVAGDLGVRER